MLRTLRAFKTVEIVEAAVKDTPAYRSRTGNDDERVRLVRHCAAAVPTEKQIINGNEHRISTHPRISKKR